jgi:hypothetical protein
MIIGHAFLAFFLPAILASIITPADDHAAILGKALREHDHTTPGRELKAATSTSRLAKRHTSFVTTSQIELTYTESKFARPQLMTLD